MAKKKNQFYAVAVGRIPGIYNSWDDCKKQTEGFKSAKFKSFATNGEALAFVEQYRIREPTATNEPPIAQQQKNCSASFDHVLSITIHFDGGSRGNPGLGGAGAQVMLTETSNETEVTERLLHLSCFLGSHRVTNNEAEYHGMLLALDEALKQVGAFAERRPPASSCQVAITINGDSDLIIQQMLGNYQVRSDNLVPLYRQANERIASIKKIVDTQVRYEHVYRDNNAVADSLANQAMDSRTSSRVIVSTRSSSKSAQEDSVIPGGVDV